MFELTYPVIEIIFLFLCYQEVYSLESEYIKEELFKLCNKEKVDMYGCVNGGV